MSFRTGRSLVSDQPDDAENAADEELDPVLIEAARQLDARPLLGVVLVLVGGLLGVVVAVILGLIVLAVVGLSQVWKRLALRRLRIQRRFEPDRIVCGDDAQMVLTAWNRKLLPIPWLRAEEPIPAELSERDARDDVEPTDDQGWRFGAAGLVNGWSLGPYERVVRTIRLKTERRGVYQFGRVNLRVGDLLGDQVAEEDRSLPTTLIVRPRTVRVRRLEVARDRAGELHTRRGLFEDPSRFAGIRPYVSGDPLRHVHWRATARLGTPVVKRFDPSRDRDVVIALDIQTIDGAWAGQHDDDLAEALCVVAASLARRLEADGASCGLAVAAFSGTIDRIAFVAPSAAQSQAGRIGDVLARLSPYPSAAFEFLLGRLARMIRPGTFVIMVSARDPGPFLPVARRLARSGFGVVHLAVGPNAEAHARRSRVVGLPALIGRLDGTWRNAEQLDVAG